MFWAAFLDSRVKADGQVPGFSNWVSTHSRQAVDTAERYADACVTKITRDRREPDECIAAGVRALRSKLAAGDVGEDAEMALPWWAK